MGRNSSMLAPYVSKLPAGCFSGPESHCLAVLPDQAWTGYSLVAAGNDQRGLVFAIYTLTEVVLGRQPYDAFLDTPYDVQSTVTVSMASVAAAVFPPPRYPYRAFFINDEDLFGGLGDPLAHSVYSAQVWDKFCEVLLRMKGLLKTNK